MPAAGHKVTALIATWIMSLPVSNRISMDLDLREIRVLKIGNVQGSTSHCLGIALDLANRIGVAIAWPEVRVATGCGKHRFDCRWSLTVEAGS